MLDKPLSYCWCARVFSICTWSYISPAVRFFRSLRRPVAQNLQAKLHPTWELMQAVSRLVVGINTPSTTRWASPSIWKAHLTVPSLLCCASTWSMRRRVNDSSSLDLNPLPKDVISSNDPAAWVHSHSDTCLVRKGFSPISTKAWVNSACESDRMSGRP